LLIENRASSNQQSAIKSAITNQQSTFSGGVMSKIPRRSLLQLVGTAGLAGLGNVRLKPDAPVFAASPREMASQQAAVQATRAISASSRPLPRACA
jgi:hypothetical protein